jgi:hypothetical protein
MTNDTKYIEKLLEIIESDKKMVMLYISFALAILVLMVEKVAFSAPSDTPRVDQNTPAKIALIASSLVLALSAFFHYLYYRRLHLNMYAMAKFILDDDANEAHDFFFNVKTGIWKRHGWKFNTGLALFWSGIVAFCVFLILAMT